MKKIVLLAAASTAMLSGCPSVEQIGGPPPINVDVTVEPAGKGVGVSREPIYVHNANTPIVWNLASSGYEFASDGIVVVNGGSEFDCSRKSAVVFMCIDKYTYANTYKYVVRVNGTAGSPTPKALDPTIVND